MTDSFEDWIAAVTSDTYDEWCERLQSEKEAASRERTRMFNKLRVVTKEAMEWHRLSVIPGSIHYIRTDKP